VTRSYQDRLPDGKFQNARRGSLGVIETGFSATHAKVQTQASSLCGRQASCLRGPRDPAHSPAGFQPVFRFAAFPRWNR